MSTAPSFDEFRRRYPLAALLPGFTPEMANHLEARVVPVAPGRHGPWDAAEVIFGIRNTAFAASLPKAAQDVLCRVAGHVLRVAGERNVVLTEAGNPRKKAVTAPDDSDRARVTATVPAAERGRVGLFFAVTEGRILHLLVHSVPLVRADVYGEKLTVEMGHDKVWERLKALGAASLRARGMPLAPASADYDLHPRGRVVYSPAEEHFFLMLDRRRHQPEAIQGLRDAFSLGAASYDVSGDPHYRTAIALEAFDEVKVHQLLG